MDIKSYLEFVSGVRGSNLILGCQRYYLLLAYLERIRSAKSLPLLLFLRIYQFRRKLQIRVQQNATNVCSFLSNSRIF